MVADSIFVTALTTGSASITVSSGTLNSTQTVNSAGVHVLSFPMGAGSQLFSFTTASGSGSGKGAIDVSSKCYVSNLP